MSVAEKTKPTIIQPNKMGLLVENPVYKPFRYPWCYDAWLTQQRIHWLPEEVPLGDDVRDWQKNLSVEEKNLLTHIFRFFTQADVEVNIEKALAGFEKSGHFFFNKPLGYGYDDGINSAIQVCQLLNNQNKNMSQIIKELPVTYQSPTMAPYCKDEEKYDVVKEMIDKILKLKNEGTKIDNQTITEVLTVNGIRFSLEDGSWGLIRASSNKPSLVIVTESTSSDKGKKEIFKFINDLLQKTGKIGEYDQKI